MGKKSSQKKNRKPGGQYNPKPNNQPVQAQHPRMSLNIPSLSGGKSKPEAVESHADNTPKPEKILNFGEQTEYIRSDITRISLLLLAVAAVLVGLVLLNDKTSVLRDGGNTLSSFMKMQQ